MPLYVIVLLVAILVLGYLIWKWMQNNVAMTFLPENFELIATNSTRDGDRLTTTFRLVPKVTDADPKKFKVTITPKVPDGQLTKGTIIGNATITPGTDNKDTYTVTFPIAQKNALSPGENYRINVNDGSSVAKQANVQEGLPVSIVRPVQTHIGDSASDCFYATVDLQYNFGSSAVGEYKVVWANTPSPNGQFRVTKHNGPNISYPIDIKVCIDKPDPMSNPHYHYIQEWHSYQHMGASINVAKDPPIKLKDPR